MTNFALTNHSNSRNDLIDNPSSRCACELVLDISGSMSGEPIRALNAGVQAFIEALKADEMSSFSVELSVITAGGRVVEELPFTTACNISEFRSLSASGATPLGEAVSLALKRLEERKAQYKRSGVAYYQPWLVIISDGAPTDNWQAAAQKALALSQASSLVVLPVGVAGADLNILGQFSHRGAKPLVGLKFRELFEWLSASMASAGPPPTPPALLWSCPPLAGGTPFNAMGQNRAVQRGGAAWAQATQQHFAFRPRL